MGNKITTEISSSFKIIIKLLHYPLILSNALMQMNLSNIDLLFYGNAKNRT